jgi:hypothetical protein
MCHRRTQTSYAHGTQMASRAAPAMAMALGIPIRPAMRPRVNIPIRLALNADLEHFHDWWNRGIPCEVAP